VTNAEIIAGLEPPESSMAAIDWITSAGAIPTVSVYRPLRGTDYEGQEPPDPEAKIPVFRHLYEACKDRGLPNGYAPNIHVSLVMLPEECASLSSRHYRWQDLKRGVIKRVLAAQLSRRLARLSA
jgi:hypothetical protein